jgi:hypothetical protein
MTGDEFARAMAEATNRYVAAQREIAKLAERDAARAQAEIDRTMAEVTYRKGRERVLAERQARRAARSEHTRKGLDRFAPGLDAKLDVVREQRRRKGGLDEADEIELGWGPRSERGRQRTPKETT